MKKFESAVMCNLEAFKAMNMSIFANTLSTPNAYLASTGTRSLDISMCCKMSFGALGRILLINSTVDLHLSHIAVRRETSSGEQPQENSACRVSSILSRLYTIGTTTTHAEFSCGDLRHPCNAADISAVPRVSPLPP